MYDRFMAQRARADSVDKAVLGIAKLAIKLTLIYAVASVALSISEAQAPHALPPPPIIKSDKIFLIPDINNRRVSIMDSTVRLGPNP